MRRLILIVCATAVMACTTAAPAPITAGSTAPAGPASTPGSADFLATVGRAAAALGADDHERARELLRAAHRMVPGDARVLFYLARAELAAGDTARALAALDLLAAQGAVRDLRADPVLGQLGGRPRFEDVAVRVRAGAAPLVRSDTAFELPDPDFLPEGIAHDPVNDVFYVGSLHRGTILRVDRTGAVRPFVNTAPGERALVTGLRVDAERRRLWAATLVVDSSAPRFRNGVGGRAALHAYDLDGGALLGASAPTDPGPHLLNDIAITADGDLYATDSEGAALYRLAVAPDRLERVHGDALNFTYPNGITLTPDGARLYVAHVEGISTIELGANAGLERLSAAPGVAMGGIDGLYACREGLLAVQSLLGFQRIVLLHLDESGRRVVRQEPLEQAHPAHDAATTGALANGAFYYIANAQLGRLDSDQRVTPAPAPRPSVVLKLPVPAQCHDPAGRRARAADRPGAASGIRSSAGSVHPRSSPRQSPTSSRPLS